MTRQFMACMWLDDAQCAGVLPEAVGIFYKFNISIKGFMQVIIYYMIV